MRILLVEDEEYIAEAVEYSLKKHNYSVDLAFDGEYGLDCALSCVYDVIILDIMLPKTDGITVLREMRREGIKTPVLMLTAKGQTNDKIHGLDSGADDYLAKPFDTGELLARLRALGRRSAELSHDGVLSFGDITLNPHTLSLCNGETEVKLTLKEAQLLELLIQRKNTVVTKETIIGKLWGYDSDAEDSHVENQVALLRRKLNQADSKTSVLTLRGVGYRLADSVKKGASR